MWEGGALDMVRDTVVLRLIEGIHSIPRTRELSVVQGGALGIIEDVCSMPWTR